MSKERYNEIIREVYKKYADSHWTPPENPKGPLLSDQLRSLRPMEHSKESFIRECKINQEFSEKWGLKIEERELSLEERMQIWNERIKGLFIMLIWGHDKTQEESLNEHNIPNKQITLTYQDEKIEVYE
jgi:hypothetical protein